MAHQTPKGRVFQKGQSGNPRGSSAKMRATAHIKRLTGAEVALMTSSILRATPDELLEKVNKREGNALEYLTGILVNTAINKSDISIYRALLDRVIGKPKETVTLGGDTDNPLITRNETRSEKLERIARLRRARAMVDVDQDDADSD